VTEFQSRRELREAERQGLVPKPEQIFDLPTGQIQLPDSASTPSVVEAQDVASVNDMLTRKRIREMERLGLLDPLTGAVRVPAPSPVEPRSYDSVLAETEEPITSSINLTSAPSYPSAPVSAEASAALTPPPVVQPKISAEPVAPTDIFHEMAVDLNAKKPRFGIILAVILVVLVGLGVAAYMLGIFK
jgi:hypothetical protein